MQVQIILLMVPDENYNNIFYVFMFLCFNGLTVINFKVEFTADFLIKVR